jgi:hypothetical protein
LSHLFWDEGWGVLVLYDNKLPGEEETVVQDLIEKAFSTVLED